MADLKAVSWKEYELLDCGNFEKLERFGKYILIRPEPQALWAPKLSQKEWHGLAHAKYVPKTSNSGDWQRFKDIDSPWFIGYKSKNLSLRFLLKFTAFKHIGIFPEQAANWEYLADYLLSLKSEKPKVLNLFAYTGGASLAAKASGADVVHLDSVKQVINWARENMEQSGLDGIRWVVEDAARFAAREAKRGNTYNAVIMDPPSYGLGPGGERWKLEDNLAEMMRNVLSILNPVSHCFIINTYSMNLSSIVLQTLAETILGKLPDPEAGELFVRSSQEQSLPLGSYLRFRKT